MTEERSTSMDHDRRRAIRLAVLFGAALLALHAAIVGLVVLGSG